MKPWKVALVIAGAGLAIGVLTVSGQGWLPGQWSTLANSGAVWLVFSFAAGSCMSSDVAGDMDGHRTGRRAGVGVAGRWWRTRSAPRTGIALLGGVFVAEGVYDVTTIPHIRPAGLVMLAAGLVLPLALGRSASERLLAFGVMLPVVAITLGAYAVINRSLVSL